MTMLQTGETRMAIFYEALSPQWRKTMERLGLGTHETEVLTQLVSTVMESPSQSISQAMEMLTSGLEDLSPTTIDLRASEDLISATLEALPNVERATWDRRPKRLKRLIVVYKDK